MAELSTQIDAIRRRADRDGGGCRARTCCSSRTCPIHRSRTARAADDNPVVRSWGEHAPEGSAPPHWEIAERLGLFDLERGAKVTGSGFILFTGPGARLDACAHRLPGRPAVGARLPEVWAPIAGQRRLRARHRPAAGQGGADVRVERDGLYLNPTAEVPVTNIYRDEILAGGRASHPARRLPALVPSRGGRCRQGHPRPAARAPVRQGRAREVRGARRPRPMSSNR